MGVRPVVLKATADKLHETMRAAIERASLGEGTSGAVELPSSRRLELAAQAVRAEADEQPADHGESRFFQSILEISYLVASADGFAAEERSALARLLEQLTGKAVSHDNLELHFSDLDAGCELLGRTARLHRAAADFDSKLDRMQAIGFATLVAIADGTLAAPEAQALSDLGRAFELDEQQVESAVSHVVEGIEKALA